MRSPSLSVICFGEIAFGSSSFMATRIRSRCGLPTAANNSVAFVMSIVATDDTFLLAHLDVVVDPFQPTAVEHKLCPGDADVGQHHLCFVGLAGSAVVVGDRLLEVGSDLDALPLTALGLVRRADRDIAIGLGLGTVCDLDDLLDAESVNEVDE